MEVSIGRSTGGSVGTVASAFTHLNNAWHDSGVHFSNISLPLNSHVNHDHWNKLILLIKLLQMILNLTAGEEILLTIPANIGTKSRFRLILLELPEDKLYSSCTVSLPVKTTLVRLSNCSLDTHNSVSVGSDGAFIAPEDGVYKAVYNGKLQYSREEKVISEDEEEVL